MLCVKLDSMCAAAGGALDRLAAELGLRSAAKDQRNTALMVAAVICAVMPLEISHLVSLLLGVAGYMLLQGLQPRMEQVPAGRARKQQAGPEWRVSREAYRASAAAPKGPQLRRPPASVAGQAGSWQRGVRPCGGTQQALEARRQEVRKPSAMPVMAPTFQGTCWEAQVQELLGQILPTAESDAVVAQIARAVKQVICVALPKAEVVALASGSLANGTAFSVAVPEVEIVISAKPDELLSRLHGRWSHGFSAKLDARKLQKSAIRACTDALVGSGTFKFRRSAFRGDEPKVTLVAPGERQGVPVNLSVNSATPLHNAALITECGRLDPRAKELILLVKRWAKDRSLCHAAKGHLSPYSWTLLTIFFLQAGSTGGPVLPPLEDFVASSALMTKKGTPAPRTRAPLAAEEGVKASIGELFKGFMAFYATEFDWSKEAASVRLGCRAPPDTGLPIHIVLSEDGSSTDVGPCVEDPFQASRNLGACMNAASLAHLRSELRRAHELCGQEASLTALLEPWAPPEAGSTEHGSEDQEEAE